MFCNGSAFFYYAVFLLFGIAIFITMEQVRNNKTSLKRSFP